MPDGLFRVVVVTPEERLLDVRARAVVLRSSDGDLTVLDGHTPLVTDVTPGEVRVEPEDGGPVRLAAHGGYLQVETGPDLDGAGSGGPGEPAGPAPGGGAGERSTRVTMLVGVAELGDRIDVARAEEARSLAEARVEAARHGSGALSEGSEGPGSLELAEAEAALRRAEVRLAVAAESGR